MTELELQIYLEKTAQKNGVSVEKVVEDIQASINAVYKNPTPAALLVPRKNAVPTILEFIDYAQSYLLKNHKGTE